MNKYKALSATSLLLSVLMVPAIASAHVVVKPATVDVAAFQTFTMGVPNEKDIPVTSLKLTMPAGLNYVSPTVKPGWTIDVTKDGDTVKDITWTGGSIPADQRDDFTFSAQAPAKASDLSWKAYQTYEDGTTVAWDQKPDGKHGEDSTPYSTTKVVNDLAPAASTDEKDKKSDATLPLVFSIVALALSAVSLGTSRRHHANNKDTTSNS